MSLETPGREGRAKYGLSETDHPHEIADDDIGVFEPNIHAYLARRFVNIRAILRYAAGMRSDFSGGQRSSEDQKFIYNAFELQTLMRHVALM